jgi:predicted nucleic acid-binding protein
MPNVVSDTSCLIALSNIGLLEILQSIYGSVSITPEVAQEFGENLPDWMTARLADLPLV